MEPFSYSVSVEKFAIKTFLSALKSAISRSAIIESTEHGHAKIEDLLRDRFRVYLCFVNFPYENYRIQSGFSSFPCKSFTFGFDVINAFLAQNVKLEKIMQYCY